MYMYSLLSISIHVNTRTFGIYAGRLTLYSYFSLGGMFASKPAFSFLYPRGSYGMSEIFY